MMTGKRENLVRQIFEKAEVPMFEERPRPELPEGPGNSDIWINPVFAGFTLWSNDQVRVEGSYSGLPGLCTLNYRFTVHISDVPPALLEEVIVTSQEYPDDPIIWKALEKFTQ